MGITVGILVMQSILYIYAIFSFFKKDSAGKSSWSLYYKKNIEIAIFHVITSFVIGTIFYRISDVATTVGRINVFLLSNGIAFIILFVLGNSSDAMKFSRLTRIILNAIILLIAVFILFKTTYHQYTERTAKKCLSCGRTVYTEDMHDDLCESCYEKYWGENGIYGKYEN